MRIRIGFMFVVFFLITAVVLVCTAQEQKGADLRLPENLVSIEDEAFMNDTSLVKVIVPEGTKHIGSLAFANSSIREIVLPKSLTYISDDAFVGCANITFSAPAGSYAAKWVYRWQNPEFTSSSSFEYRVVDGKCTITKYIGVEACVHIPETIKMSPVTGIESNAFRDCDGLKEVTVPASVTEIGSYAFLGCDSLLR